MAPYGKLVVGCWRHTKYNLQQLRVMSGGSGDSAIANSGGCSNDNINRTSLLYLGPDQKNLICGCRIEWIVSSFDDGAFQISQSLVANGWSPLRSRNKNIANFTPRHEQVSLTTNYLVVTCFSWNKTRLLPCFVDAQ